MLRAAVGPAPAVCQRLHMMLERLLDGLRHGKAAGAALQATNMAAAAHRGSFSVAALCSAAHRLPGCSGSMDTRTGH